MSLEPQVLANTADYFQKFIHHFKLLDLYDEKRVLDNVNKVADILLAALTKMKSTTVTDRLSALKVSSNLFQEQINKMYKERELECAQTMLLFSKKNVA